MGSHDITQSGKTAYTVQHVCNIKQYYDVYIVMHIKNSAVSNSHFRALSLFLLFYLFTEQ